MLVVWTVSDTLSSQLLSLTVSQSLLGAGAEKPPQERSEADTTSVSCLPLRWVELGAGGEAELSTHDPSLLVTPLSITQVGVSPVIQRH